MKNNLISIIVPAYNASQGIVKTLNSLINQTYKNLEIIIINDASKDSTLKVITEFAVKDKRIKIINLEKNVGVHEARMCGLAESKGEFIGFVDADDYVSLDMYQSMLDDAQKNEADIVICGAQRVNDNEQLGYFLCFKSDFLIDRDLFKNYTHLEFGPGSLCNKLFTREVIISIVNHKFPWRQSYHEDWVVNTNCFLNAKKVYLSKNIFYSYVKNDSSAIATVNNPKYYVEYLKAFSLSLHYYGNESSEIHNLIINMYRKFITRESSHIEYIEELHQYEKDIINAMELSGTEYPMSWALLTARNSEANGLNKKTLLKIIDKVISRFIRKNEFMYIK